MIVSDENKGASEEVLEDKRWQLYPVVFPLPTSERHLASTLQAIVTQAPLQYTSITDSLENKPDKPDPSAVH